MVADLVYRLVCNGYNLFSTDHSVGSQHQDELIPDL